MKSEDKVLAWCLKTGCTVDFDGDTIMNIDAPEGMCFEPELHSRTVGIDMQDSIEGVRRSSMFKRAWEIIQEGLTLQKCESDCSCKEAV